MSPCSIFFSCIVLGCIIFAVEALECYVCDSIPDTKCGVTWGYSKDEAEKYKVTCSEDATACRKLVSTYNINKKLVGRSCWNITNTANYSPNKCFKSDDEIESCYCLGDLCNGDNSIRAFALVTGLCLLVAMLRL